MKQVDANRARFVDELHQRLGIGGIRMNVGLENASSQNRLIRDSCQRLRSAAFSGRKGRAGPRGFWDAAQLSFGDASPSVVTISAPVTPVVARSSLPCAAAIPVAPTIAIPVTIDTLAIATS